MRGIRNCRKARWAVLLAHALPNHGLERVTPVWFVPGSAPNGPYALSLVGPNWGPYPQQHHSAKSLKPVKSVKVEDTAASKKLKSDQVAAADLLASCGQLRLGGIGASKNNVFTMGVRIDADSIRGYQTYKSILSAVKPALERVDLILSCFKPTAAQSSSPRELVLADAVTDLQRLFVSKLKDNIDPIQMSNLKALATAHPEFRSCVEWLSNKITSATSQQQQQQMLAPPPTPPPIEEIGGDTFESIGAFSLNSIREDLEAKTEKLVDSKFKGGDALEDVVGEKLEVLDSASSYADQIMRAVNILKQASEEERAAVLKPEAARVYNQLEAYNTGSPHTFTLPSGAGSQFSRGGRSGRGMRQTPTPLDSLKAEVAGAIDPKKMRELTPGLFRTLQRFTESDEEAAAERQLAGAVALARVLRQCMKAALAAAPPGLRLVADGIEAVYNREVKPSITALVGEV